MHEQLRLCNQLCFRFYSITRLINQAYHPLLEPLGLTYPQYLVMLVLWEQDNLTVSDICHRLMLDTNTLTPMLQRMEREGFIVRTHGIVDGRQTLVSLTKKGKHLEEQAKDIPYNIAYKWHGPELSQEDVTHLVAILDTLIKGLK
mgnify:CR=1 FL=1